MSNGDGSFDYLCNQFKNGIVVGAGLTLFTSGIFIGYKAATFIIGIANNVGTDTIHSFKEKVRNIIIEEEQMEDKTNNNTQGE